MLPPVEVLPPEVDEVLDVEPFGPHIPAPIESPQLQKCTWPTPGSGAGAGLGAGDGEPHPPNNHPKTLEMLLLLLPLPLPRRLQAIAGLAVMMLAVTTAMVAMRFMSDPLLNSPFAG